jgi:GNAT superfamily N-acetyltransferase
MEIRSLRQDTITDADADELARLKTLVDPGRLRSDPPVSRQLAINELRPGVSTFALEYYGLFRGATMLGVAETFGTVNAENTDVCELGVWIDPPHHGRGLHRHLFDHVDAIERSRGRTRYWGWGDLADQATRSFWEAELGYTLAYDERISRCDLADVDVAMMRQWIHQACERASGYHLIRAEAPFDDIGIDYLAQALEAMNDAPLDDLQYEPETFDRARAREIEAIQLSARGRYQAVFAVETSTGAFAGYTEVRLPNAEPALSKQNNTVTVDAHRNKGIGRWLKADMWTWLRQDRPDVQSLDTGNAESNQAMLAINEAMGFRDILHHGVWHEVN